MRRIRAQTHHPHHACRRRRCLLRPIRQPQQHPHRLHRFHALRRSRHCRHRRHRCVCHFWGRRGAPRTTDGIGRGIGRGTRDGPGATASASASASTGNTTALTRRASASAPAKLTHARGRTCWGFGRVSQPKPPPAGQASKEGGEGVGGDTEKEQQGGVPAKRKRQLLAPLYGGLTCALSFCECLSCFWGIVDVACVSFRGFAKWIGAG
jgi:hypothetical protein